MLDLWQRTCGSDRVFSVGEEYAQHFESLAFVDDMLRSCLTHMLAESRFLARVSIVIETDFCVSLDS
jgi:hypothetical protein